MLGSSWARFFFFLQTNFSASGRGMNLKHLVQLQRHEQGHHSYHHCSSPATTSISSLRPPQVLGTTTHSPSSQLPFLVPSRKFHNQLLTGQPAVWPLSRHTLCWSKENSSRCYCCCCGRGGCYLCSSSSSGSILQGERAT